MHNRKILKANRKNLRNTGTSAEAVLWTYLKARQIAGRKFRRQHSIANYIVDFYCPEERLVIELDGQSHYNVGGQISDDNRDEYLKSLGLTILRVENKWIFKNIEGVLEEIKCIFSSR